jgi:hypothetical protein
VTPFFVRKGKRGNDREMGQQEKGEKGEEIRALIF